jgi:hypothetical protein
MDYAMTSGQSLMIWSLRTAASSSPTSPSFVEGVERRPRSWPRRRGAKDFASAPQGLLYAECAWHHTGLRTCLHNVPAEQNKASPSRWVAAAV